MIKVSELDDVNMSMKDNSNSITKGDKMKQIQLPNDIQSTGYKQVRPFQHEQVFHSKEKDFEGTAKEFLDNGYAYEYVQVDKYKRYCLN